MTALTQLQLKKWYDDNIAYLDKPRKAVKVEMTNEDYAFEKDRYEHDRMTAHFERDRDDYVRDHNFLRAI